MKHQKRTLGFMIWAIAIVGWFMPLIIPFTALPVATKVITITVAVVIAEISFIVGGLLLGSEYKDRIKASLRFGRSKNSPESIDN